MIQATIAAVSGITQVEVPPAPCDTMCIAGGVQTNTEQGKLKVK